jgi:preprotein translocase subunit SecY
MLQTILNSFSVPDIRKKLMFTAAILALYRLGAYIPSPGVDANAIKDGLNNVGGSSILGFLNLFSVEASRASRCSRWASCPTSRPRSSCSF